MLMTFICMIIAMAPASVVRQYTSPPGCEACQVCSNDVPRLTLTYSMSRSNLLSVTFQLGHSRLLREGEQIFIHSNGLGHMIMMANTPIYGKTLGNLFLQNQMTDDLGTWYVAFEM